MEKMVTYNGMRDLPTHCCMGDLLELRYANGCVIQGKVVGTRTTGSVEPQLDELHLKLMGRDITIDVLQSATSVFGWRYI